MDMSPVVTNEVGQPRATLARQAPAPSAVEYPRSTISPTAPIVDFIAHQPPQLLRTPDPDLSAGSQSSTLRSRQVACQRRTPPGSSTLSPTSPPVASPR